MAKRVNKKEKQQRRFQSVYSKIMTMFLIILIIPSVIVGISAWDIAKNQLNDASRKLLQSDVRLVNGTISELEREVQSGSMTEYEAKEQVKQMILGPKDAKGARPINHRFNLGKNGYLFILDTGGTEIAHPSLEGQNIWNMKSQDGVMVGKSLVNQAEKGGGFTTYKWPYPNSKKLGNKIVYSEKAPGDWGWVVAAGSYANDYNSGANRILINISIIVILAIIIGFIAALLLTRRLTRPIIKMEAVVNRVASGDLNGEDLDIHFNDEIGRLAAGFNQMTRNLKKLINQMTLMAEQVAAASEELSASSEESTKATEQVTSTIQDTTEGAQEQNKRISDSKQSLVVMIQGVNQIAVNSNNVADSAEQTSEKTHGGNEAVEHAMKQMNEIAATVDGLSKVVRELGDQSSQIGQIVDTISSIAAQTNLLALNAAIEAARAGDSGRGFAVVAGEVRKLAEETSRSSEQIAAIISQIQKGTQHAVEETENTIKQVSSGLTAVNHAGQTFHSIRESVEAVSREIQEVSAAADDLSAGTVQLNKAMDEIAHMSEQTTDAMQVVAASTEEQLAATEEISASAADLTKMAEQLQEMIIQFKL